MSESRQDSTLTVKIYLSSRLAMLGFPAAYLARSYASYALEISLGS